MVAWGVVCLGRQRSGKELQGERGLNIGRDVNGKRTWW